MAREYTTQYNNPNLTAYCVPYERYAANKVVPASVIERAKELVEELSQADISVKARSIAEEGRMKAKQKRRPKKYDEVDLEQISLFDTVKDDDVIKELAELDISHMTPMDAMNTLYRLQNRLKNRW